MRDVLCDDVICDAHRDTHLFGIVRHSVIHYHALALLTCPRPVAIYLRSLLFTSSLVLNYSASVY